MSLSFITEAQILSQLTRLNNLLERLCLAVEHLVPPPPDTEVEWGEVTIEDIPDTPEPETGDSDSSRDAELEEIEAAVMEMTPEQYDEFVRSSGTDYRERIRTRRQNAKGTPKKEKGSDQSQGDHS